MLAFVFLIWLTFAWDLCPVGQTLNQVAVLFRLTFYVFLFMYLVTIMFLSLFLNFASL